MQNKNIKYSSRQILEFYKAERDSWEGFYESERRIFEIIAGNSKVLGDVLDVGCACGGLGAALCDKFTIRSYTGIDVNRDAVRWARGNRRLSVPFVFIEGDIVDQKSDSGYDTVISLGCADWNVETEKIIKACWGRVRPGGYFVVSLRLTPEKGMNDIKKSYQYINFSGKEEKPEIANYVVLNRDRAIGMMESLRPFPEIIGAYGYWGKPSSMARTPFREIVFSVFYAKKGREKTKATKKEIDLPI